MEELTISWTAVLVAVVANFILGFLLYTPLFGKAWAKEMGFDPDMKPSGGDMAKGMIFMVVGNFLLAYVFRTQHGRLVICTRNGSNARDWNYHEFRHFHMAWILSYRLILVR